MVLKIVLYIKILVCFSYAFSYSGDYEHGRDYDEYDHGHTNHNGHYEWGYVHVPISYKFPANQYWSPPQKPCEHFQKYQPKEIPRKPQNTQYSTNTAERKWSYKDWAQATYQIIPSIQIIQESRAYLPSVQRTEIPLTASRPTIPYVSITPSTELRLKPINKPLQPDQKSADIPKGAPRPIFVRIEDPKTSVFDTSAPNITTFENATSSSGDLETTNDDSIANTNNPSCEPYNPGQRPDFSAPNRRISQIKCYEYIWDLKVLTEKRIRERDCLKVPGVFHISVVGGHDTIAGEYPHMAAVGWKATLGTWIFKCGGSLISPKFVLTAGHCTSASPRDPTIDDVVPKIVRLGDKNILDSFMVKDVNIQRIITHPLYKAPSKYNDIALFELEEEVEFTTFISPACLFTQTGEFSETQKGTVTGWGVIEADGNKDAPELQAAEVDVIRSEECAKIFGSVCHRHWCGLQETQMCAGALTGGVDTCQGDSGGPLQVKIDLANRTEAVIHYIIGVTSFGFKCARANSPGIYTKVASYVEWIEDNVWRRD